MPYVEHQQFKINLLAGIWGFVVLRIFSRRVPRTRLTHSRSKSQGCKIVLVSHKGGPIIQIYIAFNTINNKIVLVSHQGRPRNYVISLLISYRQ